MSNFFTDNEDITFYFEHLDLDRIIELREDGFSERDAYPYAPRDVPDARDNYRRTLDVLGEMCGEYLASRAAEIDKQGVTLDGGVVTYPKAVQGFIKMLAQADLMGFSIPRKYGGLNMPVTIACFAAEIMARADGSFLIFGLHQNNAETINKFASEELKDQFLPRFATGKVSSAMILTEPEAGSDLQAVTVKAHQGEDGQWYLNGVKRFITNGCAEVGLVLARSEEGTRGGRGLSLFICERGDRVDIRRIERKLGIHGSATCELQYNNAPAYLIGQRKRGLARYTMWLMNAARLGIAGQALGIAEAAYREADAYARERIQFGKAIRELTPVYEMLTEMKIAIEAGRALFYEAARIVDLKEAMEYRAEKYPERSAELQREINQYTNYASLMTPLVKAYNTEMANRVANDAIQVHGGTGYMKEFNVERHFRDARVTNIYEGTTQLQILAARGAVTSGVAQEMIQGYLNEDCTHAPELCTKVSHANNKYEKTVAFVRERDDSAFLEYHSRRLVEMATDLIQGCLLLRDARHAERKRRVAETFLERMVHRIDSHMNFILEGESSLLRNYREIIG